MRIRQVAGVAALAATGLVLARRESDRRRARTPARADAPRAVIVGGGFGGLAAARVLGQSDLRVTLVDRRNHHLFQPLLYQVATAALSPGDIASPIRGVLRHYANIEVFLDEVVGFDLHGHRVHLKEGADLAYDYLIVAAGATHSYFGHEQWEAV